MRKVSLVVFGAALGAASVTLGTQTHILSGANAAASDTYRSLNLFGDVFEKIRTDYVEKPDDQKLVEAAINGMLTSLDPHSSYMDAKGFREMTVQTHGEFGGLGIEVSQEDGQIKVVTPIDDTPASKAGILSGDIIAAIDGEAVSGLTLNQAVDKMRGAVNTPVTLKILRGPKKDTRGHQADARRDHHQIGPQQDRRRRRRLHPHHPVQRADLRRREGGDREVQTRTSRPTSSRATSSTCATIPAACSTSRSPSPTPSSTGARSSRRAAATPTRRSATTPVPAIFRRASRWSS